jgi:ALG6, ALG8 glycosyltransferase family
VKASAYAALCGFMFGFHVHEKALLTTVVLLGTCTLSGQVSKWCAACASVLKLDSPLLTGPYCHMILLPADAGRHDSSLVSVQLACVVDLLADSES